jgi:hypothetical protein
MSNVVISDGMTNISTEGVVTTGLTANGESYSGTTYWQVPLSAEGKYKYRCSRDLDQVGYIVVSPAPTPWVYYDTTWAGSSANPVFGNAGVHTHYRKNGSTVDFRLEITAGSTTTFGSGNYSVTLPVAPVSSHKYNFDGIVTVGANMYKVIGVLASAGSTTLNLYTSTHTGSAQQLTPMTPTIPATLASGSLITIQGSYEAA